MMQALEGCTCEFCEELRRQERERRRETLRCAQCEMATPVHFAVNNFPAKYALCRECFKMVPDEMRANYGVPT